MKITTEINQRDTASFTIGDENIRTQNFTITRDTERTAVEITFSAPSCGETSLYIHKESFGEFVKNLIDFCKEVNIQIP